MNNNSSSKTYEICDNKLYIKIPIKNKGKFRWKNRDDINKYGQGFSTENVAYTKNSYVEWQIGYDVKVKEFKKDPDKKPTVLTNYKFKNEKGDEKYPYELSEFLFAMFDAKLVTKNEIESLLQEISHYSTSLEDTYKIKTETIGEKSFINNIVFEQQNITLPTFIYHEKNDIAFVEISIQKQQHATGIQPMLYFSIPIISLTDSDRMINKTSKDLSFEYTNFIVDEKNKNCILNIFKFFGICSPKHKHDVGEILKLLINKFLDNN